MKTATMLGLNAAKLNFPDAKITLRMLRSDKQGGTMIES
jgi:hypothetical protein